MLERSGGYFLKNGSQVLAIREMFPSLCNFASANEPSTEPFTERLPKNRRRHLDTPEQNKEVTLTEETSVVEP